MIAREIQNRGDWANAPHRYGIGPVDGQGWLGGARRVPSPHCDERPPEVSASLLVIHNISLPPGQWGGPWIEDLFLGRLNPDAHPYFAEIAALRVSAHLLIRRDGEVLQFVSFLQRAWHAGVSLFAGRSACNDFSIGIELEGADCVPYTDAQYAQLGRATRHLLAAYSELEPDRICGHADIAPGRKTDPGPAFDWQRYRSLLEC